MPAAHNGGLVAGVVKEGPATLPQLRTGQVVSSTSDTKLLNAISQRMPEGLYSTTDLRRWLKRLCEIQDRGSSDWQPWVMVQRLLLDVMDALSRRAPRCSVRLDHLQEFESEGMRETP